MSGIEANENSKKIAYVMVWRNEDKDHFHTPYPGHEGVFDFKAFFNSPTIIFNSDLSNLYGD